MNRRRRHAADAVSLALLALITLAMGHALLTAALAWPETVAQAAQMKGM